MLTLPMWNFKIVCINIERQKYVTYKIFWRQTRESMNVFVDRCFCVLLDCYAMTTAVPIFWLFYLLSVLFTHHCKYNRIWWYCQQSERFSALKPGLVHHFLYLKMPVPSQEYDSSCPFVFDVFRRLILPCDYGISNWIFLWVQ